MTRAILSRPWTIALVVGLITVAFAAALPSLRVDNTPEIWLPTDLDGLDDFRLFRDRFGDDSLILAFSSDGVGEPDAEAWSELIAGLREVAGVATVIPPPFVEDDADLSSPLRYYLASQDGSRAAAALFPEAELDPAARGQLVQRLEEFFAPWAERVGRIRLAGADVITHDLDIGSQESLGGLSPLVFGAMCLILFVTTREWRAVAVGLLAIVAVSIWSLGLLALAGRPLNLVLAVVPAILAVITIAQAMHILSRFQSLPDDSGTSSDWNGRLELWRQAVEATWRPCALCAVTTAAGFASLGASEIPPVRDLGLFTAAGVLFSLGLCFTLFPALLAASPKVRPRNRRRVWWTPAAAAGLGRRLHRHALPILIAAGVGVGLAILGVNQLRLESHILTFFPPDHRVPKNYRAVEEHLMGLTPFELILEGKRDVMLAPDTMRAYQAVLEDALREEGLLRQVVSLLLEPNEDGLKFVIPPEEIADTFEDEAIPESLASMVLAEEDRLVLRTTLLAVTDSSNACHDLVERLRPRFREALPEAISATITGSATLLIQGQVLLLDTQVRSFALAILVITVVIAIAFRSGKLVLISLVPNLLPIVFTLAFMGWAEIPLNTATVTVAGVALGLIVDDTIHFLHHFGSRREAGDLAPAAVASTLFHVGRPAVITSVAVAAGFGVFALAPFRPTLFFGLLIALTAVVAIVCDLIVLPAVLQWRSQGLSRSENGGHQN